MARSLKLLALAAVGAVFSYSTLYALTPIGPPLIAGCLVVGWLAFDDRALLLSVSALALGVAAFLLFLATAVDDSLGFLVSGSLVATASIAGFTVASRRPEQH